MTFWQEITFGLTLLIVGLVLEKWIDWYWPNRGKGDS